MSRFVNPTQPSIAAHFFLSSHPSLKEVSLQGHQIKSQHHNVEYVESQALTCFKVEKRKQTHKA